MMMMKALLIGALLLVSGCGRAELSAARKDYVLAKDHGWLELTVEVPPGRFRPPTNQRHCALQVDINGETFTQEALYLQGDPGHYSVNTGFLLVAPAGVSTIDLSVGDCAATTLHSTLSVTVAKNHMLQLAYNGQTLARTAEQAYLPPTLSSLDQRLRAADSAHEQQQAQVQQELRWNHQALLLLGAALIMQLLFAIFRWVKQRS